MKNIFILIIAGLFLSGFNAYSQELQETQELQKTQETVNLGFGVVQDQKTSTASTATITSDVLEERAAINLNDALYGRLLGLTALQNSGDGWVGNQGFGASYNIRGTQTLTGERNIIILVDGFERSIDRLSIDEIESVTVLKDAAAVALYGYRGINGAIYVKTKRGPATQGMKVNVKYQHKFTFLPPTTQYVDAYTYASAMNEARRNDGMGQSYSQFELDAFKSGAFPRVYADVDWQKESLRNVGSEDVVSVNFSNRTERIGFFSMINYTNIQGLLNTANDKEYSSQLMYSKGNVRTNLDVILTPSTKFEANVLGSLFENNRPAGTSASDLFMTFNFLPAAAFPINTVDNLWGGSNNFNALYVYNPVARIRDSGYNRQIGVVLNVDFKLTQSLEELVKGLSLTGRFGYDAYNIAQENRSKAYSWASDRFVFNNYGVPTDVYVRESAYETNTSLNFSKGNVTTSRRMNFVLSADYKKQLDNHNLAASLIYHYQNSVVRERYNTFFRENIMGYIHYDFASKYLADVVLAYTGSNRSYPQSWAFSPTVSLGWLISEEDFLKENDVVNLLKLRGSAGILHTDNVPRNGMIWMSVYDGSSGSFGMVNPIATSPSGYWGRLQSNMPTTDFKLERASKFNVGFDALLLNSIGLNIEAYYQRRDNIIQQETGLYSVMAGIGAGFGNWGVVDSKGIEVGLNYDRQFGNMKVNVGGMFTYGENKVIDCVEEPQAYPWLRRKGYPVDQQRGLEFIGFFEDAMDIASSPNQEFSLVRPGDAKYQLQDKGDVDKRINNYDIIPIGYSTEVPVINYAFNAGLEYKGLGANILFQGASRFSHWDDQWRLHTWGNSTARLLPLGQGRNIPLEYYENRWTPGLDNSSAKYPALSAQANPNNEQASSLWLLDASFLKLRHVELYYNLPESVLGRINLSGVRFSIRGENLYTWTPFNGVDPERFGFTYPTLKGVSAGFSVAF